MRRLLQLASVAGMTAWTGAASAQTAELPVPCVAGVCGANVPGFVSSGRANATITNNVLRVQQQTDRAILNWASFNVGPDGKVIFEQPGSSSIALNRIFDGSPSVIRGAIEANGQIYLVNQNGFLFTPTARVRTAGLLVSSLNMAESTFENGLLSPELIRAKEPALFSAAVLDPQGNPVPGDDGQPLQVMIKIEAGARISTTGAGGRVIMASRTVDNAGQIDTPDGQVILAAGEKVYLQASTDPSLRGLLVEVDAGGEAFNRMTGNVSAARGNVTMVGLAVNQQGRVSATSTVSANGSIRLLARDSVRLDGDQNPQFVATRGGRLELGASSLTTVLPELTDTATAIDEQKQLPSRVELVGRQIYVRGGAQVRAPGGEIKLRAQNERVIETDETPFVADPEARVRVESGAVLDASGSDATASVARNVVRVELRGNELRDSPLQRDGALRGKEVFVDARVGTPLADVSGAVAGIGRGIAERTSVGGTISVKSAGDIAVAPGAVFDVSGGTLTYTGAAVQTTQLLTADGRAVDIGQASATGNYVGLINPSSERRFDRWGVVEQVQGPLIGRYETGYVEGRSAGTLQFAGRAMALDGTFLGGVTAGPSQRDAARAPLGGRLIVGAALVPTASEQDYFAPSINLVSRPAPTVVGDDATLPQRPFDLSTDFATIGGFTRAELYSNGVVNIPESMMLVLAPGSSLRITARRVEAGGSISAPGGSLRFASVETVGVDNSVLPRAGVTLSTAATLDVRGTWSNELSLLSPIYRDGGDIDLAARAFGSELVIGDDVRLLASGGASLSASGIATGGRGGSIALRAGAGDGAVAIGQNAQLAGFGVAGARGGLFVLEAPRVEVASGDSWITPRRLDLDAGDSGFLSLGEGLFTDFGFTAFELTATGPRDPDSPETLRIAGGVHIDARARTLSLDDGLASRQSGGTVESFVHELLLPDFLRQPTSIALRVQASDLTRAADVGSLSVEEGASIAVEPRGSVTLSSVGALSIAGRIRAPGGVVTASTLAPPASVDIGYRPDFGITLTDTARIDLAGVALLHPNDAGLMQGEVLAGGALSLIANRGFVDVARGADIDLRGTANAIDVPGTGSPAGFQHRLIASAAGSILLRSPESLTFEASLHAQAGVGDTPAAGGTATFQLTRQRGFEPGANPLIDTYPTTPRTLLVTNDPDTTTRGRNGIGVVDTGLLRTSGVDALNFEAGDRIEFYAGADLNLARSLQIAAPIVGLSGDAVSLSAPYVSFGTTVDSSSIAAVAPISGGGRLEISGDLIELTGRSAITGVANATFDASQELRMRGFVNAGTSIGELRIAGDLNLRAPLIYPTTGTAFSIFAAGGPDDRVTFDAPPATSDAAPMSVGGSLTVEARSIVQRTRLVAPFGQISLNARDDLKLASGSLTSVSAAGSLLPFGHIQLGSWVYEMGGAQIAAPDLGGRSVDLSARDVSIDAAATVDIQGGGDLYAYEWQPGTGGSTDALAAGTTPGLYAILPSMRGGFAPFDPQEYLGSDLKPGDSIYLSGASGLPAGVYPLLPARYALLPGALLVSAVPGSTDAAPGVDTRLADGSPVVAGYRTFAGTGIRDARTTGFVVRPGAYGRRLAAYQDTRASTFDADMRPVAPDDAARLSLAATHALDLAGHVLTAANAHGRGAAIDIAAPDLAVRGAGAPIEGAVNVDSSVLQGWGAASLLLGGRRAGDGRTIDVISNRVMFAPGASLAGPEIIAVANEGIGLDAGSSVSSGDAAASLAFDDEAPLRLDGDDAGAAVLGVSATRALFVERAGAPLSAGTVTTAAGSTVSSSGALLIDGPDAIRTAGVISGAGATWALGSRDISFGGAAPSGFVIDSALRDNLAAASRLRLTAADQIDFAESLSLGSLQQIVLDTPWLTSTTAGSSVQLTADSMTLLNSGTAHTPSTVASTGGSLSFAARDLVLGPGAVGVDSFALFSLAAENEIVGHGTVSLATAGDLIMTAASLGTASDADVSISAIGLLRIAAAEHALADTTRQSSQLGGRLALDADRIEHAGNIRIGSGRVELSANSLVLESGSVLDMSGVTVSAGGRSVGSSGGAIRLNSRGTLDARAGAVLRASGAGEADAGSLSATSRGRADFGATLTAQGGAGALGGSFTADLGSIGDFGVLNRALTSGGFTERRAVRIAQGDLTLAAGDSIFAREVSLTADTGSIWIAGSIDASSDNQRGRIELTAGGNLTLAASARIAATGTGDLGRGGSLWLSSTAGNIELLAGSQIALGGAQEPGRMTVRAAATDDGMRVGSLDSSVSGVDVIALQPVLGFDLAAAPTADDFEAVRGEVDERMSTMAPALQTRFAGRATPVAVRPGIDFFTDGDLLLDTGDYNGFARSQLDLASWRFGGEAAALAFRATGSIDIAGTISDGFQTVGSRASQRLDLMAGNSSSLSFDAGTDLRVNADARVRTGTGDLSLRAGRDLIFDTNASVYTGGLPGEPTHAFAAGASFSLPVRGGRLELAAGHDVRGSEVTQSIGDWEVRQGRVFGTPTSQPGWGTDLRRFGWNAGTLGGGDLFVRAGHDIRDLSAAAADSASIVGTQVNRFGGGVLSLDAENDITSAYVHATRGRNALRAGGELGRSRDGGQETLLGSMFSLQEGSLDLTARRGIVIESVINPTVLDQSQSAAALTTYFLSYAADSHLRLRTATGDIDMDSTRERLGAFLGSDVTSSNDPSLLNLLPPTVTFESTDGDIRLVDIALLAPSDTGQLSLFARGDIYSPSNGQFAMSDASGNAIPSIIAQSRGQDFLDAIARHDVSGRHGNDESPVLVDAGRDIRGVYLLMPKFTRVNAGRDVRNTTVMAQNVRPTDATIISAGRDVIFDVDAGNKKIEIGGAGRLDVLAGRDVDLGFSAGISSLGRLANPALASEHGADITIIAGVGEALSPLEFLTHIVAPVSAYRAALQEFVSSVNGSTGESFDASVGRFTAFSADLQRAFLLPVFFTELVASGRDANNIPGAGFARGYAAIDALFPGSREPGATPRYDGDLRLAFSRIYTLADGDISLLAPGGLLNVGLANPPPGLGSRDPSALGIVAQRAGSVRIFTHDDVLVNQSRVFTLRGGDIAIWSTVGDIDAGRGAKSAISAPPPTVTVTDDGRVLLDFAGAVAGSGIRAILTADDVEPGDVDLIAPAGIVDAGDAGIGSAGNLNVAAQQVVGLDNIQVGGTSTGVPAETSNLGASLSSASAVGSSASAAATDSIAGAGAAQSTAPLADSAFGFLDVFLEGFGTEVCKPDDTECLKRNH